MYMKLSDFVAAYIKKYTDHVFLLPGGGNMHLVDSFGKEPGLTSYRACMNKLQRLRQMVMLNIQRNWSGLP